VYTRESVERHNAQLRAYIRSLHLLYLFPPLLLVLLFLPLIFPPSSLIKNRRSLYSFWPLLCPPPPPIRILLPNAQSKTRTRMYASPSEHSAICAIAPSSTPLHTHRALAVPISPTFSVPIYSHPSHFSDSAYPSSLHRILLKLSNTHHPNPCVGGPRCGR
jgi:hypothetical protein